MNKEMKIIFFGSDRFSGPILLELIKKFSVVAVVTEIDKPAGRGLEVFAPIVKIIARRHGIPCFQPLSLKKNPKVCAQLKEFDADIGVVAAFGKILPADYLNLPKNGCLNIHPSLLPKYRGASPIQTALLGGEKFTGASIILMGEGLDDGDILCQQKAAIEPQDDYSSLVEKLSLLSAELIVKKLSPFVSGELSLKVQNDKEATYCRKIKKSDGRIDWGKPAENVLNQIRAFKEWPGSYTFFGNKKLDIIEAMPAEDKEDGGSAGLVIAKGRKYFVQCGNGLLELKRVKIEGKKEMAALDFCNGHKDFIGAVLGFNK